MPAGVVDSDEMEFAEFFELMCSLVDTDVKAPTVNYEEFI